MASWSNSSDVALAGAALDPVENSAEFGSPLHKMISPMLCTTGGARPSHATT